MRQKVKRLRWSVEEEDWFPVTRDSRVDRRFWTLLQASFYETYQRRGLLAFLKYPFYPLFILDNGMNLISKSLTVLTPA